MMISSLQCTESINVPAKPLRKDPFQPHFELHSLVGKLQDCYAVRLTCSYRVTLTLLVTDKEIILLDIGSHDEVYK